MRDRWHGNAWRLLGRAVAARSEAAEHAARAGVIGDSEAVSVLVQAGRLAMREGAIARAREHLSAAVEVAGSRAAAELLMDLGEVLLDSGDGRGGVATFRRVLEVPALTEQVRSACNLM